MWYHNRYVGQFYIYCGSCVFFVRLFFVPNKIIYLLKEADVCSRYRILLFLHLIFTFNFFNRDLRKPIPIHGLISATANSSMLSNCELITYMISKWIHSIHSLYTFNSRINHHRRRCHCHHHRHSRRCSMFFLFVVFSLHILSFHSIVPSCFYFHVPWCAIPHDVWIFPNAKPKNSGFVFVWYNRSTHYREEKNYAHTKWKKRRWNCG